jgi:hypothetical protein
MRSIPLREMQLSATAASVLPAGEPFVGADMDSLRGKEVYTPW